MSLPSDSRTWLASVVADPWDADDAVDRQRSMAFRGPMAGVGELSGEGDSHLKVGGRASEVSAMVGIRLVWTTGQLRVRPGIFRMIGIGSRSGWYIVVFRTDSVGLD